MRKKLVYVFGPDGAGKSTITNELTQLVPNAVSLNAANPASWPDRSWHEEIIAKQLDPNTLDPSFHITAMTRCYRAANGLLQLNGIDTVFMDSDLRAKAAAKAAAWYGHTTPLRDIYEQLTKPTNAQLDDSVHQIGLHVTIGGGSAEARAAELMQRVNQRGEASFYDPQSIKDATSLIETFDALEQVIAERGDSLIRVETDRPNVAEHIGRLIMTA